MQSALNRHTPAEALTELLSDGQREFMEATAAAAIWSKPRHAPRRPTVLTSSTWSLVGHLLNALGSSGGSSPIAGTW
ncbi:hypothetical protein QQY66_01265 [Streptomyces sp. DG2A-72]|uniref:hypothetical protein n=1 Tax=Streptomyces sp. DG2A-72 TaxID=3051386 RepID=UPI00265C24B2|nr:hypothetical protein [Streptomyces sp. DG2A-72]MDO0930392.1 hypothetical protein [Streptomyces sp. DG2A-72]